jgi:hypothetical protein
VLPAPPSLKPLVFSTANYGYVPVFDLSVRRQTYVEDCEVCCKPIEISYSVQDDALAGFNAKTLE